MKYILLFLSLILLAYLPVTAQKIHFTDSTNKWKVLNDGGGTEYYSYIMSYTYGLDTFFNGHVYKRLNTSVKNIVVWNPNYPKHGLEADDYCFREDTLLQR